MKTKLFIRVISVIVIASVSMMGCDTQYIQPDDPAVQNNSTPNGGEETGSSNMFTGPDVPMNQTLDNGWSGGYRVNGQPAERKPSSVQKVGSGYTYNSLEGTWFIKPECASNFKHFCQNDAKKDYPGGVLCGPSCYMMVAQMIACECRFCYSCDKPQVGVIYTRLKNAGKFDDKLGMYINDLMWYAKTYDNSFIQSSYMRTQDRSEMKEYIENTIKTGYPVIVTVQIHGYNGSYSANDADKTNQPNKSYYIDSSASVGHFILVVGIKINADGSGHVYYYDPLTKTAMMRSTSYTRILDSMKANGNPSYYDAVAVMRNGVYL